MISLMRTVGVLICILASGAAFADTDCSDPVADWQPREVLRKKMEQRGVTVQRIKVDDGCYEVRGIDRRGNKFKARFSPASLRIRLLEIRFDQETDPFDYLERSPQKR